MSEQKQVKKQKGKPKSRIIDLGDEPDIITNVLVKTYDAQHNVEKIIETDDYSVSSMSLADMNDAIGWTTTHVVIKSKKQNFLFEVAKDELQPIRYEIITGEGLLMIGYSTQFIMGGQNFIIESGRKHRFINTHEQSPLEFRMDYSGDIDFNALFGKTRAERTKTQVDEEMKRDRQMDAQRSSANTIFNDAPFFNNSGSNK